MKIFILLSRVPYPLEKGDKVRAFNQIKSLSKHHEIVLYAINDQANDPNAHDVLSPLCNTFKIVNQKKNNINIGRNNMGLLRKVYRFSDDIILSIVNVVNCSGYCI